MKDEYSIITTTYVDREAAKRLANRLIEKRLAACIQMLPIESIYLWQQKICDANEVLLIIKSKTELFEKIATEIKESHTYEVPEILQVPITGGLPEYLAWIDGYTSDK